MISYFLWRIFTIKIGAKSSDAREIFHLTKFWRGIAIARCGIDGINFPIGSNMSAWICI